MLKIESVNDISQAISNGRLNQFWNKLGENSKRTILEKYLKSLNGTTTENILTLYKNKLVIEKDIGLCRRYSGSLESIAKSGILTAQSFIDGNLCNDRIEGNIAPFCTHFVKSPSNYLLDDLKLAIIKYKNGEYSDVAEDCIAFCDDLISFNCMDYFLNPKNRGYINYFPIIYLYKRKNDDIDIMNDENLDIHKEFKQYSFIVDLDEDGLPEFEPFMKRTMAILGGVNIKALNGIIIGEEIMKNSMNLNYSIEELIDFVIEHFPNLYISNEKGEILYKPKDIKIKTLEKIDSPIIHNCN